MTAVEPLRHGTRAMYRRGGCREECCRRAMRNAEKHRNLMRQRGITAMVDATSVRVHVLRLQAFGVGAAQLARLAGCSTMTVRRIASGQLFGESGTAVVHRRIAHSILSVEMLLDHVPDAGRTPAAVTHRRLRELVAAGWSQCEIARRVGMHQAQIHCHVQGRHRFVSGRFARQVRDLHAALTGVAPPVGTAKEREVVTRSRNVARRNGWTAAA